MGGDDEQFQPGRHGTPVQGVPLYPPAHHKLEVSNLTVSVTHVVAILFALFGVAGVYFSTKAHQENRVIHLDEEVSRKSGGAAYQSDIQAVQKSIAAEQKKTRKVLHGMKINCTKRAGEGFVCAIDLPEEDE